MKHTQEVALSVCLSVDLSGDKLFVVYICLSRRGSVVCLEQNFRGGEHHVM